MGDRVSIQFEHNGEKSIVLFSHWRGQELVLDVKDYVKQLMKDTKGKRYTPRDRLEPNTIMVDFVRHITKELEVVDSDLYFGATVLDGDNSDNGHYLIELWEDE